MSLEKVEISKEELESFFNKYNILELDLFTNIFEYSYGYDITDALEIARKVYKEKYIECYKEFEIVRHCMYPSVTRLEKKELTDKELKFLYELSDNALMCLTSIKHDDVEYEVIEMSKLVDSLEKRFEQKEVNNKVKCLKLEK